MELHGIPTTIIFARVSGSMKNIMLMVPFVIAAFSQTISAQNSEQHVRKLLKTYCQDCHSGAKPKGRLNLDQLEADFSLASNRERWHTLLKRVHANEMPPDGKPQPTKEEKELLTSWIEARSREARRASGRTVLRRLNRVEYQNTIRDLLGITVDLASKLPEDSSAHGFDINGEAHHVSSFLLEKYLEAADLALSLAIANDPQPPLIAKRYSLKDQHQVKATTEKVFRIEGDTVTMYSSSAWQAVHLYQFYPSHGGRYRFRISASAVQSADKPVTYRVAVASKQMSGKNGLIGYFDAPAGKPGIVDFVEYLEPRTTIHILPYGLASAQAVNKIGADQYQGPGLAVQFVEVEGPLHESWPPASHRRIFGDLKQKPSPIFNNSKRVEVESKTPEADAEKILRSFARRAFRRPATDADLKPILELVNQKLASGYSFERAVRVGLMAILVSPEFLFLRETPGQLNDFAFASRLSYFLWSTMPDEELLKHAESGKLSQPDILREQVERLLNDPKSGQFTENFVGQWLRLREIDATEPSHLLYPEFDHMLKVSMILEAELFFNELLKQNLSLSHFVASDFSMLNARLAKHYGIPGPDGFTFQKVTLPPGSHRGGLLTMASVLKVTANGTTTSPVLRGKWVLDQILGTPPAPPPPDIPTIEPDIRGATTIREQLAKHRQDPSCASCHKTIDPPGFALESFDVIGGWREQYRTTGNGDRKEVIVDGRRMPYRMGARIDPSGTMPNGDPFRNIDEFKELLLKDRDQLARALTVKLLTYATGATPDEFDQRDIEAIVSKVRTKNYGLRSLIHEIVQSPLFQTK